MTKQITTYMAGNSYHYEIREGDQLRGKLIKNVGGFQSSQEALKEGNKLLRNLK